VRYKHPVNTYKATGRGRPASGTAITDRLSLAGPVLTSAMAAVRLHLHPRTVMERARAGQLPGRKLGHDWRFVAAALDAAVRGERWDSLAFEDEVLTTVQVAEMLGIGVDKVGRLARDGQLPHWGEPRARRFGRAAVLRVLCGPAPESEQVPSSPI